MTTRQSSPCAWPSIVLNCLMALSCVHTNAAMAGGGPAQQHVPAELFLAVSLNGVELGRVIRLVERDKMFAASAQTLREIGLKWPGSADAVGSIALNELPGLEVRYDAARQHLAMIAPVEILDRPLQALAPTQSERARVDPETLVPGMVLNYEIYGQRTRGNGSLSATTEARVFGVGPGTWSHGMVNSVADGASPSRSMRLDTRWQRDFPDAMTTLTLGDFPSGALPWTRAVRMGGIRLATNFQLQPYRVTTPLPSLLGSAVLPSTVDLFVNGMKQSTQQVQPGNFQLGAIPSLNGTGQAQMVITDLNGQVRTLNVDLYGAPQLLRRGLSDWSVEVGAVRQGFGLRSFSYADTPVVSAMLRHGWTDRATLEAHAEVTRDLVLGGLGGVWLLERNAGVLSASAAGSHSNAGSGYQVGGSYQWNSQRLTLSVNTLRATRRYRDVADLYDAVHAQRTDSAFAGVNGKWGQLGLSLIRQSSAATAPVTLVSLGWSRQFAGNATLSLSINRTLGGDGGSKLYASWSMPLDRLTSIGASANHGRSGPTVTLDTARSIAGDEAGWGWRLQQALGSSDLTQAQLNLQNPVGQWSVGANRPLDGPGASTVYASANGSIGWMQGHVEATRQVDNAFALVSTDGIAGVPVRLENRPVGVTDARGQLLVPHLNAYQHNRLSIDTLGMPSDMRAERETLLAVPAARSGMVAQFRLRRTLAVQIALRDAAGEWLPLGSRVEVFGPAEALSSAPEVLQTARVGYDGEVYLEDPPTGASLQVETPFGTCRAKLPTMSQRYGLIVTGALPCH